MVQSLCGVIFSTEDGQFDVEYLQQVLAIPFEGKGHYATIGDKKYSVYLDSQASVVYFLMRLVSMKPTLVL